MQRTGKYRWNWERKMADSIINRTTEPAAIMESNNKNSQKKNQFFQSSSKSNSVIHRYKVKIKFCLNLREDESLENLLKFFMKEKHRK